MNHPVRRLIIIVAVILIPLGVFWYTQKSDIVPQETPTPSVSVREPNITVTSPLSGATVTNPITVTGQARVFENTFNYILKDANGTKLVESYSMTDAPDAGIFGNYTLKIPVPLNASKNLVIEVFEYSAKDGSVINLVQVPVVLETQEQMKVKVHFNNSQLDPQNNCDKTFAVDRNVIKTKETAYIALTELLKGPTAQEKSVGYQTSLPDSKTQPIKIHSLNIRGGTAYADFDAALEANVAGSCRVTAIRSQITNTLKQFPTIKDVVISIYGRTEDILQP